jgi:cytoskeletal protein RodZ
MVHAGERLSEERLKKNLTLEEVAKATKIKVSFLRAIENGEYSRLPSRAYVHGFVKNYADFLGLSEDKYLALFKREYDEEKHKVLPDAFVKSNDFPLKKIKFSFVIKVFVLIVIILGFYLFFQYRSAFFNPPLSISFPKQNAVIASQEVLVTGRTDPNAAVFVNDSIASIDKDGNFEKKISVFPGRSTITVKAVNNFSKTTIVQREIEVEE